MGDARKLGYTYDDLHVGMSFRSPGRTITDADIVAFSGLTGDYSELHTSDVYAKASQFGRRVAQGMLGLAYAHGLDVGAHRRAARDGDCVPWHQRVEVRGTHLYR